MRLLFYVTLITGLVFLASAAPGKSRQSKNYPYFDYNYEIVDNDYLSMELEDNDLSRTIPNRKDLIPSNYNSPVYYIKLPPEPYVFVPGFGYYSPPPPSPFSQFVNLPLRFVSNGKPSTIYRWNGNVPQIAPPKPINNPHKIPSDSTIHRLPGQYSFNGKPDDIFVLRDSYNSLYSDALQNFYP